MEIECNRCNGEREVVQKIAVPEKDFPEGGVILFNYFDKSRAELTKEPVDKVYVRSEGFRKGGWSEDPENPGFIHVKTVCPDCVDLSNNLAGAFLLFLP